MYIQEASNNSHKLTLSVACYMDICSRLVMFLQGSSLSVLSFKTFRTAKQASLCLSPFQLFVNRLVVSDAGQISSKGPLNNFTNKLN